MASTGSAALISNSTQQPYTKAAPAPRATRLSILGALCRMPLKPLTKNRWFMTMMIPVSSSCIRPIAMGFASSASGSGHPHMLWPMDRYMSRSRKPREEKRRFFKAGVSLSASVSPSGAFVFSPFGPAP